MPVLILLFLMITACATESPSLSPIPKTSFSSDSAVIQVVVKPIVTKGIDSEDERKWGVDLSAYFTAFEIRVINHTEKEILLNPSLSRLIDNEGDSRSALNEEESVRYYLTGDGEAIVTLVPKPKEIIEDETRKIKAARISGGVIVPDGEKGGILLFKKISPDRCRKVVLVLNGISVVESAEVKTFSFSFKCDEQSR